MIGESLNTGMMALVVLYKDDQGAALMVTPFDLFCESCDSSKTPAYCHLCCEEAMKILGGEKL